MHPQFTAEGAARIEFVILTVAGLACSLIALAATCGVVFMLVRAKRRPEG